MPSNGRITHIVHHIIKLSNNTLQSIQLKLRNPNTDTVGRALHIRSSHAIHWDILRYGNRCSKWHHVHLNVKLRFFTVRTKPQGCALVTIIGTASKFRSACTEWDSLALWRLGSKVK
jgi:hypothetical protein